MCLSFFKIQNLCQFLAKSEFSQKDIHRAFSNLYPSVLLSCQHHLKAKFRMYFAQPSFCIFEWCGSTTRGSLQRMTEAEHNRPIPKLFGNRPSASAAKVFVKQSAWSYVFEKILIRIVSFFFAPKLKRSLAKEKLINF